MTKTILKKKKLYLEFDKMLNFDFIPILLPSKISTCNLRLKFSNCTNFSVKQHIFLTYRICPQLLKTVEKLTNLSLSGFTRRL